MICVCAFCTTSIAHTFDLSLPCFTRVDAAIAVTIASHCPEVDAALLISN